jgi:hypothetical protein
VVAGAGGADRRDGRSGDHRIFHAYAQFRIIVSQLIYPVVSLLVEGPLVAAVWNAFQIVASIVGFVASALQVWRVLKPFLTRAGSAAFQR